MPKAVLLINSRKKHNAYETPADIHKEIQLQQQQQQQQQHQSGGSHTHRDQRALEGQTI